VDGGSWSGLRASVGKDITMRKRALYKRVIRTTATDDGNKAGQLGGRDLCGGFQIFTIRCFGVSRP
jgi:hypothetical protein